MMSDDLKDLVHQWRQQQTGAELEVRILLSVAEDLAEIATAARQSAHEPESARLYLAASTRLVTVIQAVLREAGNSSPLADQLLSILSSEPQ